MNSNDHNIDTNTAEAHAIETQGEAFDTSEIAHLMEELPINPAGGSRGLFALVVDASSSMAGSPIAEVNKGLIAAAAELRQGKAAVRAKTLLTVFGEGEPRPVWFEPGCFSPPVLTAGGLTPMWAAIDRALDAMEQQIARWNDEGLRVNSHVIILTDGSPTDDELESQVMRRVKQAREFGIQFTAAGVGDGADFKVLRRLTPNVIALKNANFAEFFVWASRQFSRQIVAAA